MDIAFCYDHVQPARGGCERNIVSLARRLAMDGHQLHIYASTWDAAALPAGTYYHRLPLLRGPRFLRPWRFGDACLRATRDAGHDVTVGFNKTWGQDILCPQDGLHVASVAHHLLKYRGPARGLAYLVRRLDLAHWSYSRLERHQYLGPQRPLVIALSHMVAGHFQQYYGIDPAKIRVVHCAFDPDRFKALDPARGRSYRQKWGIGPQETVALFAAMNYRRKGLGPLLHAVRQLPVNHPFRLLVVGSPRTRPYERLSRWLGIESRVCFAGPCPDMRQCYSTADFLVHPSFYDPFGLVVLEAMSYGLPVITTRYTGAGELMTPPREGYVISDPYDHAQLARCMTELLDPSRRAACSKAARETASRWTFEHHYRQMLQVFSEVAARKQAA